MMATDLDDSILTNSETDYFTAFSTVDGFASLRHAKEGTYFIQTLLDVWQNHFNNTEIQDLMKMVKEHFFTVADKHFFYIFLKFKNKPLFHSEAKSLFVLPSEHILCEKCSQRSILVHENVTISVPCSYSNALVGN